MSEKSNSLRSATPCGQVKSKRKKNSGNLYRFPLRLFAELISSERQLSALTAIETACFPALMQEDRQDFETFLHDRYASGLILYDDAKPIGYILGYHIDPLNSARALESDAFIREHQDRIFYISSLAILEEHRTVLTLEFLIHEMAALLKSIDYSYFTAYVRKKHGLSRLLRQRLSARFIHTDENWESTGEAFDYYIVDLASIPSLPDAADAFISRLRVLRRRLKGIAH